MKKRGNPGSELAKMRWAKPWADRNQPREAGKLGGRPRDPDRCPCGEMTRERAIKRGHHCEAAK